MNTLTTYQKFDFQIDQINTYRDFLNEYGFIHFKRFISRQNVNKIIKAINEIEIDWISSDRKKIFGIPIIYGKDIDGHRIVQRFPFTSLFHKYFSCFYIKRKLFLIKKLLGDAYRIGKNENDGIVTNHYINNEAGKNIMNKMGWHTDSARDIFYLRKMQPFYNVGIHLDDCDRVKGGLRVLAGTHKQVLKSLLFRKLYFVNNKKDPDETIIEVEAGDLTIHDGKIWHRVAQSEVLGEASRRRVIYFPFILGKPNLKNSKSKTPLYMRVLNTFKSWV